MSASVIVLNKNYSYWCEADLKRVLKLWLKNKIEIISEDDSREIASSDPTNTFLVKIKMPLVVRLLNFVGYKIKEEKIPYSDAAIFDRDNNVCQYWHTDINGKKFKYRCNAQERTIDHIVPVSKGGKNSFENCVCSCRNCNEKIKKNRTPEEAGLELIRKPEAPIRKKGEMVVMRFNFDPRKKTHQALYKIMGLEFSNRA